MKRINPQILKRLCIRVFGLLCFGILLLCYSSVSAQSKVPPVKGCVEFTDLQNGSLMANLQADAKVQTRKYLWTNWEGNKPSCADLVLHSPNGRVFKWTYTLSIDKSQKKLLTIRFFENGEPQSTLTVYDVRRFQNDPGYVLELLDENGKRMGIL